MRDDAGTWGSLKSLLGEDRLRDHLDLVSNRIAEQDIPRQVRAAVKESLLGLLSEQSSLSHPRVADLWRDICEQCDLGVSSLLRLALPGRSKALRRMLGERPCGSRSSSPSSGLVIRDAPEDVPSPHLRQPVAMSQSWRSVLGVDQRAVAASLRAQRLTAVAVVPARDEEATVAGVVKPLVRHLVKHGVLAEVVVVDDGSTDRTAVRAHDAGARVVRAGDVLPLQEGTGKGGAMWRGLAATTADLVAYVDADLVDFDPDTVTRLLRPLVEDPSAGLVKGTWHRPLGDDPTGGGRVTELAARPLLARFFPGLTFVRQPLAGEYAGTRSLLERLPYLAGWGVDIGLLLDAARVGGVDCIRQVDLGTRRHRNRPLAQLAVPAATVLLAVLDRAGIAVDEDPALSLDGVDVRITELPPLCTLALPRHVP